ncbi:MAG: putative aminopeptidase NPEPL1 [Chlamydiales bacterium]|jgi:probable aminopeptidase NPEPL1
MTKMRSAKTLAALLKGADSLLVIGSGKRLRSKGRRGATAMLPAMVARAVRDLASQVSAGPMGREVTTWTGASPARLGVGLLPEETSRYNTPSHAESIRRIVAGSRISQGKHLAVLLVLEDKQHLLAAANAVARALPLYYRGKVHPGPALVTLMAIGPANEAVALSKVVWCTLESSREAARLVDTAPSDLNPAAFQREAWKLLRGATGVTKRAIAGKQLETGGFGGILGVGKCATEGPRVLVLDYKPKRKSKRHVALVGKGITYDTGGLSLKMRGGMVGMKADMGGAAAVLGAFNVLARTGYAHRLSAVLCVAENAIGPLATKPDDILEMHSGLTVEINNTDAEGRLVLADGVSFAARKLGADTIVDAATLTGAQGVATGKLHSAVVANEAKLEQAVVDAGRSSGDLVHPLPFAPELYRPEFASTVADMRNSVANRSNAQVSCAAEFIHWHLDGTDARWAHVDLASPAFINRRATGYGVALLAEVARRV